jgi:hypothetical protein
LSVGQPELQPIVSNILGEAVVQILTVISFFSDFSDKFLVFLTNTDNITAEM